MTGLIGQVSPNLLGTESGVLFDKLPGGIDRIIPWFGRGSPDELGWKLAMEGGNGVLTRTCSSRSLLVVKQPNLDLPVIQENIFAMSDDKSDPLECLACVTVEEGKSKCFVSQLDVHKRCGHFHIEALKASCPTCDRMKGQRSLHGKSRPWMNPL
jgi:hypothetical protein